MYKYLDMKVLIISVMSLFFSASVANAQFGKLLDSAKESVDKLKEIGGDEGAVDISGGLKEALENGVSEAVDKLGADEGYYESPYKILVPEEALKVVSTVSKVPGFKNVETKLVRKMNEAAELAVKKATPIFVSAIKQMTIKDAKDILFGADDAATGYLKESSNQKLYDDFRPIITAALDEVNANSYWSSAVGAYNKIPLTKDVNPELDDHVTNKSIEGLFSLIAKKELGIRTDIGQRTSPLLIDVFGKLDEK